MDAVMIPDQSAYADLRQIAELEERVQRLENEKNQVLSERYGLERALQATNEDRQLLLHMPHEALLSKKQALETRVKQLETSLGTTERARVGEEFGRRKAEGELRVAQSELEA
jgi:hypothetical protein